MKKVILLSVLCVLCAFLFVSCHTTDHYIPVKVNLTDRINFVFAQRPDNGELRIIEDVRDIFDIQANAEAYFLAWELWESYAESLETTLLSIQETFNDSSRTSPVS